VLILPFTSLVQDPYLQQMTESEPLTLEEEYEMQVRCLQSHVIAMLVEAQPGGILKGDLHEPDPPGITQGSVGVVGRVHYSASGMCWLLEPRSAGGRMSIRSHSLCWTPLNLTRLVQGLMGGAWQVGSALRCCQMEVGLLVTLTDG
jgi:hypothetical protein